MGNSAKTALDIFVIGGGINGTGIARDAVGRGLTVALAEMNDLAWATSSASTKLFHGGLRYLEYFEFDLVKKALIEREVLLRNMPHISWPMRFVLPYHKDMRFENTTPTSRLLSTVMPWMKGRRPAWLIRLGLFMYDSLGGRKILPSTKTLNLNVALEGAVLKDKYKKAYEYSDCWVEDSRLVVLNAQDAALRGANIMTRTKVTTAERVDGLWKITVEHNGQSDVFWAKALVNAGGPWVVDIIQGAVRLNATEGIRLVRGSHIVTKRLFDHDKAYFFQGEDGRIIFAIPYENDFTVIGTTDADHDGADNAPECTIEEQDYLCAFASNYFKQPITKDDIVWTYSGVRPLYDDGAQNASAATRDYVFTKNEEGAPLLNIFGGKITTYRKLAEGALAELADYFPDMGPNWTKIAPMPGGDFAVNDVSKLIERIENKYTFIEGDQAARLIKAYGTQADGILKDATTAADLGEDFGAGLTEVEVAWLMDNEFATTAADVVWRRSKLGLRMTKEQIARLDSWMQTRTSS